MKPIAEIEEAGCSSFEATLGLVDGTLSGAERAAAEQHAASCPLCGPMVAEWVPVNAALVRHFDDKAELAKPMLAQMPDRVFAAIDQAASKKVPAGLFARLAAMLHVSKPQLGFIAAAAAIALVVVPLTQTGEPASQPAVRPSPTPTTTASVDEEAGDFHVSKLAFDGASGTVYTAGDDTPVIWVTETDGA